MTKNDFVASVAEKTGLTKKDSQAAIDAVFESITEVLEKKDKLQIPGFGTFQTSERKERIGRNPATREEITIPASVGVTLKISSKLKERLNK